jgi:hypothetical protein
VKSSGAAGVSVDAGGFGGSGATSGVGAFGGSAGTGGVGAVGGTGGVGAFGGTGGGGFSGGDAGILGYEPGAVGAPCTVDTECEAAQKSRTCFDETYFAPALTLPGGYCAELCDLSGICEIGAACIAIPTPVGFPVPVCMRTCRSDTDCRVAEGYSCNQPFTSTSSVCSLRVN